MGEFAEWVDKSSINSQLTPSSYSINTSLVSSLLRMINLLQFVGFWLYPTLYDFAHVCYSKFQTKLEGSFTHLSLIHKDLKEGAITQVQKRIPPSKF